MQRSRRSSSIGGSLLSVCNSPRRSSINPKDIERIQAALSKRSKVSSQLILFIIISAPLFIFPYNFAISDCHGSFLQLLQNVYADNQLIYRIFPPPFRSVAWRTLAFIILIQYTFSIILPHDEVLIQNSSGDRERKKVNGFSSYVLLLLLFILGASLRLYKGSVIYEQWAEILSLLNLLSFGLVVVLYAKANIGSISNAHKRKVGCIEEDKVDNVTRKVTFGIELTKSTKKLGTDPICDIYFGSELSPILYSIDVKHFVTYRVAFPLWALYDISAIYHNFDLYGKVNICLLACVLLHLTYIGRSQWFEYLHYAGLDSQNDKAGFYRIWGVLVFLPALYVTPVTVIAQQKRTILLPFMVFLFILSLISMYINADVDRQKFRFRQSNGLMKIWGKDPFFINAKYRRESGEAAANLLLGSGWWCFSRHLNYLTEWLCFLFWTLIQGKSTFITYLPLMFLGTFLYSRMKRDETRCLAKYGQYWLQYTNRVPFLLIPNIY